MGPAQRPRRTRCARAGGLGRRVDDRTDRQRIDRVVAHRRHPDDQRHRLARQVGTDRHQADAEDGDDRERPTWRMRAFVDAGKAARARQHVVPREGEQETAGRRHVGQTPGVERDHRDDLEHDRPGRPQRRFEDMRDRNRCARRRCEIVDVDRQGDDHAESDDDRQRERRQSARGTCFRASLRLLCKISRALESGEYPDRQQTG